MSLSEFKDDVSDEISTLLSSEFTIEVRKTSTVPHSDDPFITFPNLETKIQKCKMIETTVLYIDLRRSTNLNLEHKPNTVAKLYSAFIRSMTQCATYYGGHVRGIIGDRVMVIFDSDGCFKNAVNTAILMNSVVQYLLDESFPANDVKCGIGIDYGRMLVAKTGIRKNGNETHNYKNLVWLGRPANIASKLTDLAHKTSVNLEDVVIEGMDWNGERFNWNAPISPAQFVRRLENTYSGSLIKHIDPRFGAFAIIPSTRNRTTKAIMMTKVVHDGFVAEKPNDASVTNGWWSKIAVDVPGYSADVMHGDVHFKVFSS